MKRKFEKFLPPENLRDHPLILQWEKERISLNHMAEYRVKKGLPLTDEALLKKSGLVDELAEAVMELCAHSSKT